MSTPHKLVLLLGAVTCFAAGAGACYFTLKPIVRFAEEAPLFVISEQTNVLKHLRTGKEKEISELLEKVVWIQISAHAERMAQGNPPPEALQRDLAYHCDQLRKSAESTLSKTRQTRERWCKALNA
jgi:hypothetical protein